MLSYLCIVKFNHNHFRTLAAVFCLQGFNLAAQTLSVSATSLSFWDVYTDAPAEQSITLTNTGTVPLNVLDANVFGPAFSLEDTYWVLAPGASADVTVRFEPRHNIPFNTELVLVPEGGEGNIAIDLRGRGVYADGYYDVTQDLSQEALKNALGDLIDGHTSLGYTPARDEMYMVIDNQRVNGAGAAVNTLETCYIGRIAAGYVDRTDAQNSDNVNTEHSWPQSDFGSSEPMQSDLFHLFIADAGTNSTRSNLPFGNVVTPDWTSGGSKRGGGLFEPRDEHKGRTSRAILYFYLHYGNPGAFLTTSQENALRGWHQNFPPEDIEIRRNDDIYAVQGNRNPLIDHPEFDERINSYLAVAVEPERNSLAVTSEEINFGFLTESESRTFDLVLVADGNRDVNLSDLEVNSSSISLEIPAGPIAIGESGVIRLTYTPTGTELLEDTLFFNSSSSNIPEAAVAIRAGANFTGLNDAPGSGADWNAFIAGQGTLQVGWTLPANGMVRLWSVTGQLLAVRAVDGQLGLHIDLGSSIQGIVLVEWNHGEQSHLTRVYNP